MTTLWLILATVVGVLGAIILQGTKKITTSPPHKGQATRLGKRVPGKFYDEGWRFFFLYPHVVGFIPVKVERITFEVVSEKTRTPDRSESRIPVTLTIRPVPEMLIEYIDSGQEEGVKHQLTGKIQERVREWASGLEEGPADWIELNQSQLEATSMLVTKVARNSLIEIPIYAQPVPTWIWLRYFAKPRPTKFLVNEKTWAGEDGKWQRVLDVLEKIEKDYGSDAVRDLEIAVTGRRKQIEDLRTGTGKIVLDDLGVILERLNLGDIDVLGKVGEEAEEQAKEEQQRRAEELELKFVRERIAELMLPPFNYSNAEARDIVQTERGKVVRTIDDKQISLGAETAKIVGSFVEGKKI